MVKFIEQEVCQYKNSSTELGGHVDETVFITV
jgi:hypothetical protein